MTKQSKPKAQKSLKLAELQEAYKVTTTKKPAKAKKPVHMVTLFLPQNLVKFKTDKEGKVIRVLVRDAAKDGGFSAWRAFLAATGEQRTVNGRYIPVTAPLHAWVAVNMEHVKRNVFTEPRVRFEKEQKERAKFASVPVKKPVKEAA